MSKITRYDGNLVPFGINATGTNRTIFGSLTQSDDLTANIDNGLYKIGWEFVGPSDKPTIQDFCGATFTNAQLSAYLHQMGVAEWNGAQEYHFGSIANRSGTIYSCLTADHVSATPPESDPANWIAQGYRAGDILIRPTGAVPVGMLECDGSAISRTTYAPLFSEIGILYGAGDGSTTFNIPDLRGEFIRGWDNSRGVDPGRSIGSSQADDLKSHTHTYDGTSINVGFLSVGPGRDFQNTIGTTSGATGGAETRPRNVAMMFCIKY